MELSARLRGREEKEFTFINYHPLVRNDKPSHPLEIAKCLSSFPHDVSFVKRKKQNSPDEVVLSYLQCKSQKAQ